MKSLFEHRWLFVLFLIILIPQKSHSQGKWQPYLNVGYVTSFVTETDKLKPDNGGSVRIGVMNKGLFRNGKLGFFASYLWFNTYPPAGSEYVDSGKTFAAGMNYRLLGSGVAELYANLGIGMERFTSTYATYSDTETNIQPELGLLLNIKYFNAFVGWQPSSPHLFVMGIGFTLYGKSTVTDLGF